MRFFLMSDVVSAVLVAATFLFSVQGAPVDLGLADPYAILAGTTVTSGGTVGTVVIGDIGIFPGNEITGFPPGVQTGEFNAGNAAAGGAKGALTTAYNFVAGQPINATLSNQDLGGMTLLPGVYKFSVAAAMNGMLTLDAVGNPNAVWMFQIGSSLLIAEGSSVIFKDSIGNPDYVYWQIGSSATLETNVAMVGNMLALTAINLNIGATVLGRCLARNAEVTLHRNPITIPPKIPTSMPTAAPSMMPSVSPSVNPTVTPSAAPTKTPSAMPSTIPTPTPSTMPTVSPSLSPSVAPTRVPSVSPSFAQTFLPTVQDAPSPPPTLTPSVAPSTTITMAPTVNPTTQPSLTPSVKPTVAPSNQPTATPTLQPTLTPTVTPTVNPTEHPSASPSASPTLAPTSQPTVVPTASPTANPSAVPSVSPSVEATVGPTFVNQPTVPPSLNPTTAPSLSPSKDPTTAPSRVPSFAPSVRPSVTTTASPTLKEYPITLGLAEPYAILAGSTVTSTGVVGTVVTGNIGIFPGSSITGFPPAVLNGAVDSANGASGGAQGDLTVAYNAVAARRFNTTLSNQNLGGMTLPPGVYKFDGAAAMNGALTLDARGNAAAVWMFQIGASFLITEGSSVGFKDSIGNPDLVYWQVGTSATIAKDVFMIGNILALASITVSNGATVKGRCLARNAAVTLDKSVITKPAIIAFSATQTVSGISLEQFNANATLNTEVIKTAISETMPGVFPSNITNLNVTAGPSSAAIALFLRSTTARALAVDSIILKYNVFVFTTKTSEELQTELTTAVNDGSFNTNMQNAATERGATNLQSATSDSIETETIDPTGTTEPSSDSDNGGLTENDKMGISIGVILGVSAIIFFLIWWFGCFAASAKAPAAETGASSTELTSPTAGGAPSTKLEY